MEQHVTTVCEICIIRAVHLRCLSEILVLCLGQYSTKLTAVMAVT